jgi:hypothetical protein
MLYTFGKILFPKMLHREKALRARMRWVAGILGFVVLVLVVTVIVRLNDPRIAYRKDIKSHTIQNPYSGQR